MNAGPVRPPPGVLALTVREQIELDLGLVPGLDRRRSRYGDGFSYFVGNREIAHFHGDGSMDIRLTRERIRELRSEGRLDPRVQTRGPSADWVRLPLAKSAERPLALELVEDATRANA